jgi:hypothetical protein
MTVSGVHGAGSVRVTPSDTECRDDDTRIERKESHARTEEKQEQKSRQVTESGYGENVDINA